MAHTDTACEQCLQVDDHPKLHYGAETYHHDCMPGKVVRDFTTAGYWGGNGQWVEGEKLSEDDVHPTHQHALKLRDAALKGTKGDELRKLSARLADKED